MYMLGQGIEHRGEISASSWEPKQNHEWDHAFIDKV